MRKLLLVTLLVCLSALAAQAQSITNPPFRSFLPEEVNETSGLFFHNGVLWTHNDSGGQPILYGLDTNDFHVAQRITIANAKNRDWEDVCTDGTTVFIGDFGNNKGKRTDLRIYYFPLEAIPASGDAIVEADSIRFVFGDQTDFTKRKVHDFDCEAIFATERYLYLFSKGWETGTTRLYRLEKQGREQVAEVVSSFDSKGLITGADYCKEENVVVLVGYVNKVWQPFLYVIANFDEDQYKAEGIRIDLPNHLGTQTEGIAFFKDLKCYISAETSPTFTTRVFTIDFEKWVKRLQKRQ